MNLVFPESRRLTEVVWGEEERNKSFKSELFCLKKEAVSIKSFPCQAIAELVMDNASIPVQRAHTTLVPTASESMFWLGLDRFDFRADAKSGCRGLPKCKF